MSCLRFRTLCEHVQLRVCVSSMYGSHAFHSAVLKWQHMLTERWLLMPAAIVLAPYLQM
jgi:hypothetical protein